MIFMAKKLILFNYCKVYNIFILIYFNIIMEYNSMDYFKFILIFII